MNPTCIRLNLNFISCSLFVLSLTSFNTHAQFAAELKKADMLYEANAFHEATGAYQSIPNSDWQTLEKLAHSYRLNHDTQNAEKYYAMVVDKSYDPMTYLYYAQALQSNGKGDLAMAYFDKYDKVRATNSDKRGAIMLEQLGNPDLPNNENVHFYHLANINSEAMDYSPALYQDGLVFLSTRKQNSWRDTKKATDKWTGEGFSTLFYSTQQSKDVLSPPAPFSLELDMTYHEGPLAFSQNRELLYYTRNVKRRNKEGKKQRLLAISTAVKEGDRWLKDKTLKLDAPFANNTHPALSPNEDYMVFASDRPGGYGGMDLYIVYKNGDEWGLPINLGPEINTIGNEVFPFVFDHGALFFASDGRAGLGGLDIFYAYMGEDGTFSDANNLGTPFNSPKDDFGLVLDKKGVKGYLTSARDGGEGKDDIYCFEY